MKIAEEIARQIVRASVINNPERYGIHCSERFTVEAVEIIVDRSWESMLRVAESVHSTVAARYGDAVMTALSAASDHLDYCGYGDSWERECADHSKLPETIATALELGRAAGLKVISMEEHT